MTATHLDPATVARLVDDAVTAPSMHNAQPWKFVFRAGSGVLALYGDPERAMTRTDPNHRALHLGCAAALFNLRVSAAWNGLPVRVRLLPDDSEPWLLATVAFDGTAGEERELASLHDAVRRRRTSRYPFGDDPVPDALLDGLAAAARMEGCRLTVPDTWHIDTVLGLVRDAEHREEIDPLVRAETAAWTSRVRGATGGRRDGVPAAAFGPRSSAGPAPVRDFGRAGPVPDRGWAVFEKRPQLALLGTSGDTRTDWLHAGQALERVLLQATADGLATSMTSQPLEWPELRWTVRDPVAAVGHVQMVLRLGYGPAGPATPRRPVSEVLEVREIRELP
ncbi:nitroreductase [Streptomyces nojiriensis]|uniref:Nitroreductase n=1 Tax=Streptomyces nojiriensis TaxID=66374 RepID=A0ABQ3SPB1_9ACTN|nr:nitroreductase family protein [Streptomyces nojiriensis]QTI43531.1 Putative NAD(P)H nitroreductase [Streptomyces nojiriensis]GGS38480.1 nitroreductase [Streptomyces nojiriensis]GHI69984.1 nitroreductase [Streptomyces nojiriensis]